MTMIKILEAPDKNKRARMCTFPNFNGNHQFNLYDYDIRIYYYKLFDNRTSKDKLYIDKYNSLDELEEDIYGNITHIDGGNGLLKVLKKSMKVLIKRNSLSR